VAATSPDLADAGSAPHDPLVSGPLKKRDHRLQGPDTFRVYFRGAYRYRNGDLIHDVLYHIKESMTPLGLEVIVLRGDNDFGFDSLVHRAASSLGLRQRTYPIEVYRLGRAAVPVRDRWVLDTERPNLIASFGNHVHGQVTAWLARLGIPIIAYDRVYNSDPDEELAHPRPTGGQAMVGLFWATEVPVRDADREWAASHLGGDTPAGFIPAPISRDTPADDA